jgi:hypothetical protein
VATALVTLLAQHPVFSSERGQLLALGFRQADLAV